MSSAVNCHLIDAMELVRKLIFHAAIFRGVVNMRRLFILWARAGMRTEGKERSYNWNVWSTE